MPQTVCNTPRYRKLSYYLIAAWLVCLIWSASPLSAQPPHKTVLLLCDALEWDDLTDSNYPHLRTFAEQGAVGLMNDFVEGEKTPLNAYLTLAYGVHTAPEPNLADTPNVTGRHVLFPSVSLRAYRSLGSLPLGAVLRNALPNLRLELYGDTDTKPLNKNPALFVVDEKGEGEITAEPSRRDADAPFGKIDDPLVLASRVRESSADFVVVALGDTSRLEAVRGSLLPSAYTQARNNALRRLNILLLILMAQEKESTDILLASAYPPREEIGIVGYWQRLTPVVAWGEHFSPGLLTSPTTRTEGLVANIDIAPTLLNLLEVDPPASMSGRPLRISSHSPDTALRMALLARLDYLSQRNLQALLYVTPVLFVLGAWGIGCALFAHRRGSRWARPLSLCFVGVINTPAALMLAPLLVPPTLLEYALRILAWMVALCLPAYLLSRWLRVSVLLAGVLMNVAIVLIDIGAGQSLMKESFVTNSALVGVRYYGIGNEYLGLMMGYALMGGFAWMEERRQTMGRYPKPVWVIGGWLLCLALFGLPRLGANAGSFVVCSVGFGMGSLLLLGKPLKVRYVPFWMVLGLILAFGTSFLDSRLFHEGASHIGTALHNAKQGGGAASLVEIVKRKLALGWRTLFSVWVFLALGGISFVFWGFYRLQRVALERVFEGFPLLKGGVLVVLATVVASLLFKDTGAMTAVLLLSVTALILTGYTTLESEGDTAKEEVA